MWVLIEWLDTTSIQDAWCSEEEASELKPAIIRTVGTVIHANDDFVIISGSVGTEGELGDVNCIPCGCIVFQTPLRSPNMGKRNYRKEYDNYHAKPDQKKRRASRNKARATAMKQGRVKKGDGKDVHHATGNPMNNSSLTIKSKSANRSFARTKSGAKKHKRS
tara:strand:- start:65 stop:553 length:489 start_codon:yes stop_codon:yes gene_type:complete